MLEKINFQFVRDLEGGQQLYGYVPTSRGQVIGRSGVTIASGVDIGQMSDEEIDRLPISTSLKEKLKPYALRIGGLALEALQKTPLTLTKEEADEIDTAIGTRIFQVLIRLYDKSSKERFAEIPDKAQTVLASISYHRGPYIWKLSPYSDLWGSAIVGDWGDLRSQLNDFPTTSKWLKKRRMREAELLNGL